MGYTLFLAKRLSLSADERKNSPAIKVAVIAVALSVAVMLFAIAIVMGFKREIRNKVIGFNSHITLYIEPDGTEDGNLISLTPTLKSILDAQDYIKEYSLQASIPAIMKTPDNFKGVYLKSLEGTSVGNFLKSSLESGTIPDFSNPDNSSRVVISRLTADKLGLKTGDKIDIYFMSGSIRMRRLEIAGIFNTHFDSYDDIFIYGALPLIQKLGDVKRNQGTSLTITTNDFNDIDTNTALLTEVLHQAIADGLLYRIYRVDNAVNQGAGYFNWLALLDTNVIVILTLMTIVACATLISALLIIILDKRRFIGLLRALGATTKAIKRIFILLSLKIALWGLLAGNAIAIILLYLQDKFHLLRLDAESYYIDFVPVDINYVAVILLNAATLTIVYFCLIPPSSFVSKISPMETIKAEE